MQLMTNKLMTNVTTPDIRYYDSIEAIGEILSRKPKSDDEIWEEIKSRSMSIPFRE
jgi:hypothetical protein